MEWIETPDSTNLEGFGYDEENAVLRVYFKRGATYDYFDVPKEVFEAMKAAPSRGRFLVGEIKGNYRYAKV